MSTTNKQLTANHLASLPPDVSSGSGESRYLGIPPTRLTADRVYVTTHSTPQRSMREAMSNVLSGQSHTLLALDAVDVYRAAANGQTAPSSYPRIPYSESVHETPSATLTLRSVDPLEVPPPLDYKKSPYCCVPLPSIMPGPDIPILDPILAYSDWRRGIDSQIQSIDAYRYHTCAPATNPRVESATILLPGGQGITVHASFQVRASGA